VAIIELADEADRRDFGGTDYNLGMLELEWSMPRFDPAADAWVVEGPNGDLAAYCHLTRRARKAPEAVGYVHPDHRGRGIGGWLVDTAERRSREIVFAPGADFPPTAVQLTNARTPGASELLESRGYQVDRIFWRMSVALGDVAPDQPAVPERIELRSMRLGEDDRAVHGMLAAAFSDHWGSSPLPFDEWRTVRLGNRMFDPELCPLAWRGDQLVGASLNLDEDGEAWVQTLGVVREARGTGVGRALLIESFRAFHRRGHRTVYLGVDSENATGATRLYEKAGMVVDRRWLHWQKPLT
jgi:mycothiol synthase